MFGQLLDEPDCLRAVRDGTGSSEGKTAKGRRLSVEELAQRWPVAFPAMQQMRSVIPESGGPESLARRRPAFARGTQMTQANK